MTHTPRSSGAAVLANLALDKLPATCEPASAFPAERVSQRRQDRCGSRTAGPPTVPKPARLRLRAATLPRRSSLLIVALVAVLTALVGVGRAAADPSSPPPSSPPPSSAPFNGAPTPGASPTSMAPSAPPDIAQCGGIVPDDQQRWCVRWARYTPDAPQGSPSHWLTACQQSLTTDEMALCEAVALSLDERPDDGTATVLADVPAGTASSPDLVRCSMFADRAATEPSQASRWTFKRDRCAVAARPVSFLLRDPAASGTPAPPGSPTPGDERESCGPADIACQVEQGVASVLDNAVSNGIQGLVDIAVQGMAWALGEVAKLVFSVAGPASPDSSFYLAYNSTSGILLLLVLLFFIISTIINGLRLQGPTPVATIGGLVRALLGITFAGGIAFLIIAAWDEATNALIERNSQTPWDPALWVKAISSLSGGAGTALIALMISLFCLIGLLLVAIQMLFRGVLATGAALFGAMAMAGQVNSDTRHWGRRWFWTVNALAASRFFQAELWMYGSRGAYQSDLVNALKAVLMIWLMVMTPWVLLRLMTIFDGYLSDINARGVLAAVGSAVGSAAGEAVHGAGGAGGGQKGGAGGPSDAAGRALLVGDMPYGSFHLGVVTWMPDE